MTPQTTPRWTLALTSLAFFMVALDALVVTTALPAIEHELHLSVSALEWTVNAYALTYAAGIVTAAALGDRLGRRRVFVAGLALFTSASAACALAPDEQLLLLARAVQGVGAAAVMPLSLTILTSAFPPERRGAVVGVWGAIGGLAVASGPLIGGAITQGIDWHWIFWVNVPIGATVALLTRSRLNESFGPRSPLDLAGLGLVTLAAVALVWGLVRAGNVGWGSIEVLVTLLGGSALLVCFVIWEKRVESPMLTPAMFANRTFSAANATAFLMTGAIMAAAFLIAQYFQLALGHGPWATGVRLLPWTATPIFVAPLAGSLSDRIGTRPLMVFGMLFQAVGLGWFALHAGAHASYGGLVIPLIVAGVGISMAMPTTPAAAIGAVAPHEVGKASGTNSTLQRFGGAFGVAVATTVFSSAGHLGTAASFAAGFRPALLTAAFLSLAGAATATLIRSHRAALVSAPGAPASVATASAAGA